LSTSWFIITRLPLSAQPPRRPLQGKRIWKLSSRRTVWHPFLRALRLHSRHKRGTQLHIALLGRTGSSSLEVRGVVRAEKIEHAPHPSERAAPLTLVRGRSAYVLRKGAIRSDSNWDFQMRLPEAASPPPRSPATSWRGNASGEARAPALQRIHHRSAEIERSMSEKGSCWPKTGVLPAVFGHRAG
jgi:hypothetical protein